MLLKMYLLFLMIVYVFASDQDLCKLCDRPKDHIFCIFPSPSPANNAKCQSVDISKTDDAFRKKVLDWHNDYRDQFAGGQWKDQGGRFPQAADMRYLSYDMELEKLAMRNVQNCYYNHEGCRKTKRFSYGQNMGYYAFSNKKGLPKDSQETWESWVGEMKDFQVTGNNIEKFSTSGSRGAVLHFTQATWSSLRYIGCAQVTSKQGEWFRIDVVCNYGPDGNMMGDPLYKKGKPCSKCPSGTKCGSKYRNLCVGNDQKENENRVRSEPSNSRPNGKTKKKDKTMSKGNMLRSTLIIFICFLSTNFF